MNKKIPDNQIRVIKWLYGPEGGFTIRGIAKTYGVSPTQIHRILRDKRKGLGPTAIPADAEIIRLSVEGQRQIAEAILNPPPPAEALRRAFERHKLLV